MAIRINLKRLYRNYADVRESELKKAIAKNTDIIISCDEIPGQTMTLTPHDLNTRVAAITKTKGSITGELYNIYSFKWQRDATKELI